MPLNGKIMFVGSIGLEDADSVFTALGDKIGERAKRYPDGETGIRHQWVRWVFNLFDEHPGLTPADQDTNRHQNQPIQQTPPMFLLAKGESEETLHFDTLGYAAEAISSYAKFTAHKDEGSIPDDVLFQVSLPTAVALSTTFMDISDRARIEPAVEAGLRRDVEAICAAIPADQLAIQWDVAHEIIAHDGGRDRWTLHYDELFEGSIDRICRQIDYVPEGVEAGVHLCYGDPGHKHIVEPEDLSTCVSFANEIFATANRTVDWIHMPVPRDRDDDEYFKPLRGLNIKSETELYLGLVHHTDGVNGTNARVAIAEKYAGEFGIATECGFGRRPPETIPELLDIHVAVADGCC